MKSTATRHAAICCFLACASCRSSSSGTKPAPSSDALVGTYEATGGGIPLGLTQHRSGFYESTVMLTPSGAAYHMTRKSGDSPTEDGSALAIGSMLYAGWGTGDYGVAVYSAKNGAVTGTVAAPNATSVGTETLTGPPGFDGTYQAVGARGGDGGVYSGTVTIHHGKGDVYELSYRFGSDWYSGIGLMVGDVLVVGTGPDASTMSVGAYDVSARTLHGTWTTSRAVSVAGDTLTKT